MKWFFEERKKKYYFANKIPIFKSIRNFVFICFIVLLFLPVLALNENSGDNSTYSPLATIDSLNCILVGNIDLSFSEDVFVRGSLAYVADGDGGLKIIDISNPTEPVEIGSYSYGYEYALAVYVVDNYAYLAYNGAGLVIVDISDPTAPEFVSQYSVFGTGILAKDIIVRGYYAYIAYEEGLVIVDVRIVRSPSYVNKYNNGTYTHGIYLVDNYAYIAGINGRVSIINISNLNNLFEVGAYNTGGRAWDVYVVDEFAYIFDLDKSFIILNISDLTNPVKVGTCEYPAPDEAKICVVDKIAYLGIKSYGLRILDVEDPSNLTEIGYYVCSDQSFLYGALGVFVIDNLVYTAFLKTGLSIIQHMKRGYIFDMICNPEMLNYNEPTTLNINLKKACVNEAPFLIAEVYLEDYTGQIISEIKTPDINGNVVFEILKTDTFPIYLVAENLIELEQIERREIKVDYKLFANVIFTDEIPVLIYDNINVQVFKSLENDPKVLFPLSDVTVTLTDEIENGYFEEGLTNISGQYVFNHYPEVTKPHILTISKLGYVSETYNVTPYMWSYSENATGPNNGNNIIRNTETGKLYMTYYQYNPAPIPYILASKKRVIRAYSDSNGDWWYVGDIAYGQNPSIAITEGTIDGIFYDNGAGYIYDNTILPSPITIINGSISVEPGSMWNNNITNLLHSSGIKYLGSINYPHLVHAVFPYDDPESAAEEILIGPDGEIAGNDAAYLVIPAHNPSICMFSNINTTENEPIIAFEDKNSEICWKRYKSDIPEWWPADRKSFSLDQISRNPHIDAYGDNVSLVWEEEIATGTDEYRIYLDNSRFFGDDTETDKKYPKVKRSSYISFVENNNAVNMWYYKDGYSRKINLTSSAQDISYPDFEVKTRLVRPFLTEHTVYYMFTESAGDIYKIKTGIETFTTNDLIQPLFDMVLIDTIEEVSNSPLEDYIPSNQRPIERLSSTVKGFDDNKYYELIITTTNNNKNTPYVLLIDGQEEAVIYGKDNEITIPVAIEDILDNELIVSLDRVKGNPNRTIDIKLYEYDEKAEEEIIETANTMLTPFKPVETIAPFSVINRGIQTGNYQLEINLPNNSVVKIGIYDIMGREVNVMTKELIKGKNILNIKKTDKHNNELSKGVYFIRVETDNNNYTGKLINLK